MKFEKIDSYTISCTLTENDMIENDIELDDFFNNREKVHNFMEVLMGKAKDEVGYQLNENILSIQIMPLPKNGLSITISGKTEKEVSDLLGNVKNLANIISDDLSGDQESGNNSLGNPESALNDELLEQDKLVEKVIRNNSKKSVQEAEPKDGIKIFKFTSLKDVEGFCKTMQRPKYVISHLFKDETENDYFLAIEQGRLTKTTFNMVCERAVEFADLISRESSFMVFINEHYESIISKKAIYTMRKIASIN